MNEEGGSAIDRIATALEGMHKTQRQMATALDDLAGYQEDIPDYSEVLETIAEQLHLIAEHGTALP